MHTGKHCASNAGDILLPLGPVAQSVEQRIENPCVGGSIPPQATSFLWYLGLSHGILFNNAHKPHVKRLNDVKRFFDLSVALIAAVFLALPIMALACTVKWTSSGPALYWSDRVGRHNRIFKMPKFRSMRIDTPAVATHLLDNPGQWLTPIGSFLRKSSLDELPQLWSILKGDMSWVGPRPALFNQDDLIALRTEKGVHELVPGLTGWAQVNGRDELPIPEKVAYDVAYLHSQSFLFDIKILWLTVMKVIASKGVSH